MKNYFFLTCWLYPLLIFRKGKASLRGLQETPPEQEDTAETAGPPF